MNAIRQTILKIYPLKNPLMQTWKWRLKKFTKVAGNYHIFRYINIEIAYPSDAMDF